MGVNVSSPDEFYGLDVENERLAYYQSRYAVAIAQYHMM
jgi:hypothetical protein